MAHRLLYRLTFPWCVMVDAGFEALLILRPLNAQRNITVSRELSFIEVQFLCSRLKKMNISKISTFFLKLINTSYIESKG